MAKYGVTAGCGHESTVELYGPEKERQRRLEWMRSPTGMCNTCYTEHKRREEAVRKEAELDKEAAALARTLTPDKLDAARKTLRQAEILNHPKAAVMARALALYCQAQEVSP